MSQRSFFWTPVLSLVLAVASVHAFADGMSNNPDDYDVPKYGRLLDESNARLNDAKKDVEEFRNKFTQASAQLTQEQNTLNALFGDRDATKQNVDASEAKVAQIREAINKTMAEINRLKEEIPSAEVALMDERARHDSFQAHVAQADAQAANLENAAAQKQAQAQALAQNAAQKRDALAQATTQLNTLNSQLQAALASEQGTTRKLADLKTRIGQLASQLDAAKGGTARLEAETAAKLAAAGQADSDAAKSDADAAAAEKAHAPDAVAKRGRANAASRKAQQAHVDYNSSSKALEAARGQRDRLATDLAQAQKDQADAQSQYNSTDGQVLSLRGQISNQQTIVARAQTDAAQAQQLANAAQSEASGATAQATQARQTANDLKAGVTESERKLAEIQNRVNQLHQRDADFKNQLADLNNQNNAGTEQTRQLREHLRDLEPKIEAQRSQVKAVSDTVGQLNARLDRAADRLREADRDRAFFADRFEFVKATFQRGMEIATAEGSNDGAVDGSFEGNRQGSMLGQRDGAALGERDGRERGIRDGIDRSRAAGNTDGMQAGQSQGTQKGTQEGNAKGLADGQANGRVQGLQEGFDAGHKEGYDASYPQGQDAGHAMGGYDKGHTAGYAQGLARATSEGNAKGATDGTQQGNDEFYNANLADVSVPNHGAGGVRSASFDRPQWGNFNPHRGYPVDPLQRQYRERYEHAFYDAAADAYDRAYAEIYERTRSQTYEQVRQDYANRDYPNERKAAYDQAYAQTYEPARAAASDAAYKAAYQPAFDQARLDALPSRHEEGKQAGQKEGFDAGKNEAYQADLTRGQAEGDQAGYDATYQTAYTAAKTKAYNTVVAYFSNNAVLKFDGAVTVDGNDDGVYAPGETVSLAIAMKNFGKLAQSNSIAVQLSNASAGLVLDTPTDTLAPLAGQSRSMVSGVTAFRIAPTAKVGGSESLTVTVKQNGKVLGQSQLNMTVGYPYAITDIQHDNYPSAGTANSVVVKLRNASSKASASDVTVRLISLDNLATPPTASTSVARLAAGATIESQFTFSFEEANANKVLNFEVQVLEGEWLLGRRQFSVDSTKRWQYNDTSHGLIVLNESDVANKLDRVSKLNGMGLDAYDVRVEGELTIDKADKYLGKMIVLMPESRSNFTGSTRDSIDSYIRAGGHVVVLTNDGWQYNDVGRDVNGYAQQLRSYQLGDLSIFAMNDFQTSNVAGSIAYAATNATSEAIAADLLDFELINKAFTAKIGAYLASAAANDESARRASSVLLFALAKELGDNKAVDGKNFSKDQSANTKLVAFVNTALSKTGADRRALLALYPAIEKLRTSVEKDGWFRSTPIKTVLKPLQKAYNTEIAGRSGN